MDDVQYARDLKEMIEADTEHLAGCLERGDRTNAHGYVDSIINNRRALEDLNGKQ